jgi:hypothetical protein
MLIAIWVLAGLGLAAAIGLCVAMRQAERRARRTLFRVLGLDEATVELLMTRNGDVLAELTLVRRQELAAPEAPPEPATTRPKPAIRLVHPTAEEASSASPPPPDPGRPPGDRRRLRLPGRS